MNELDDAIERVSRGLVAGIDDEWKDDVDLILTELLRRMRAKPAAIVVDLTDEQKVEFMRAWNAGAPERSRG